MRESRFMANWVPAGRTEDIGEGEGRVVAAGGVEIALFRIDGAFHAIENACAHQGGPLGEGMLDGTTVTCPWHFWSYDVRSGRNTTSAEIGVKKFPVEVRGEEIYVDIS
jgi:nitrite reductase (NADH) small subunit